MDPLASELTNIFGIQGAFDLTIAGRFLLAIAIGLLIGMEREIAGIHSGQHKIAGMRTITFVALLGAASIMLDTHGVLFLVLLVLLGGFFITSYIRNSIKTGNTGLTTSIITLFAYLLGAMTMRGEIATTFNGSPVMLNLTLFSVVLTIAIAMLLSLKHALERAVASVTPSEFFSSLKFLVIAFIVLPFLPDASLDTMVQVDNFATKTLLSAVNLHSLWLMVVLISGISFVGYVLSKILGANRGVSLSGFLGGLISSTAVTSSMATRSKGHTISINPYILATVIASITAFVRVLIEVAIINRSLVSLVALPMLTMAGAAVAWIAFLPRETGGKGDTHVEHESPFAMLPALKLTGFILLIKIIMKVALAYEVPGGLYVTSLISGLADIDAVTLNASSLAREGLLAGDVAATSITLAVLSNMAVKTGLAVMAGSTEFGRKIRRIFLSVIVAGLAAAVLQQLF